MGRTADRMTPDTRKRAVGGKIFQEGSMYAGKNPFDPKDSSVQGSGDVSRTPPKEDPSTPKSYPGAASSLTPGNPTQQRMQNIVKETKLDEISDELKARFYKKSEKPRSVKMDGKTVGKIRFEPKEGGKVGQGEWIGRHRQAHNTGIEHGTPARHLAKQIVRDTEREHQSDMAWKKSLRKEETLDEAVSRKHFQQVADLIKGHESQEKRNELASHHASIFAKQNPRFNHEKFHAAAGSTAHQAPKKMEEAKKWIQAAIKKKGALSKELGVPEKKNIPVSKLKAAADEPGKLGKRARLAMTLRKLHKEDTSF